jgi:predicted metal-dependent hydrolase
MRQKRTARATALKSSSLDDIGAPVEVRRHPGARRLTLRVSRTRRAVIVTLPLQCGLDEAGTFINRNLDWVRARLNTLPVPVVFRDGVYIPLRGEPHRIVFIGPQRGCRTIRKAPGLMFPELRVPGDPATAPKRLAHWLMDEARRDLDDRVMWHSRNLGLRAKRIAVRDQSSRWGSCSTTGALSFSWRLVLAPPHILDYVAAHEVAHLKEMNHGARFWALVRKTCPSMDEAKRWLQIYGMDLHRYGAGSD